MPADPEHDLLARLNALKKSHISLSQEAPYSSLSPDQPAVDDVQAETDLAARFRKLSGKNSNAGSSNHHGRADATREQANGVTAHNEEDDRTLEELLSEVTSEEQWSHTPGNTQHLKELLDEAKRTLPPPHRPKRVDVREGGSSAGENQESHDKAGNEDKAGRRLPQPGMVDWKAFRDMDEEQKDRGIAERDDQEAEYYIAKLLAELDLEKQSGIQGDERNWQDLSPDRTSIQRSGVTLSDSAQEHTSSTPPRHSTLSEPSMFDLPDTPTTLAPSTSPSQETPVSALPSVPSFAPSRKPPITAEKSSRHREYTDEEINSWCCICLDDATVECLGCAQEGTEEGDNLYCDKCWGEGHRGEGAGLEERRHKAVRLEKGRGDVKGYEKRKIAVGSR